MLNFQTVNAFQSEGSALQTCFRLFANERRSLAGERDLLRGRPHQWPTLDFAEQRVDTLTMSQPCMKFGELSDRSICKRLYPRVRRPLAQPPRFFKRG